MNEESEVKNENDTNDHLKANVDPLKLSTLTIPLYLKIEERNINIFESLKMEVNKLTLSNREYFRIPVITNFGGRPLFTFVEKVPSFFSMMSKRLKEGIKITDKSLPQYAGESVKEFSVGVKESWITLKTQNVPHEVSFDVSEMDENIL